MFAPVNMLVTHCPVCSPLSYYGGKTGLVEKESKYMCSLCWKELSGLFKYMAKATGDSGFITNREPIIGYASGEQIKAYLAGSGLPYRLYKENNGNYKIEKLCGIPLGE